MLKTLDILIGVATIMLLFSMAVTIVTQAVATLRQSRGKHLLEGLASLLRQIDPQLPQEIASRIADSVLRSPLVAGPKGTLGEVVSREDFTQRLLELASGESTAQLETTARNALLDLLKKNGISDPAETLKDIRAAAQLIEASNPELANDVRNTMAILQEARSQFVAKVHQRFDQAIDYVSARFTITARVITFVAALIVAFTVQLDTFALVDRLSVDDQFRDAVRGSAQALINSLPSPTPTPAPADASASSASPATAAPSPAATASPAGAPSPGAGATPAATPAATASPAPAAAAAASPAPSPSPSPSPDPTAQIQQRYYDLLSQAGLVTMPGKHWGDRWSWGKLPGILLSALLLSLGAPFWYGRLQDLLRLRSALAQSDAQQRSIRQTTQKTGAAGATSGVTASAVAVALPGEQGDITAVG